MAVTNENRKISYVIDGTSEFTYAYTFDIILPGDVSLTFFDTDGVEVVVVMVRTISSSPAANEYYIDETNSNVVIGGAGTLQTQYGTTITQLLITRTVDITQETTLPVATSLQSDAIETALDKNIMTTQELNEVVSRALVIPIQDDSAQVVDLPPAAERVNQFLTFDSLGNPAVGDSPAGGAIISVVMQPFTAAATLAVARTLLDVYVKASVYTQTEADVITDALAVLVAANVTDTIFETEHVAAGTHNQTKVGYIDRGDPASVDFDEGDLTTDNTWNDLDLSSIINNSRAKAVVLRLVVEDDAVASIFSVRKNGNSNSVAIPSLRTQVANVATDGMLIVACDTSQVIEYRASNLAWVSIGIVVIGWFV